MKSNHSAKDEKLINVKSCLPATRSYSGYTETEVLTQDPDEETKAGGP